MVEDLIKRLRDDAGFDGQKLLAANALEQQAARIAELTTCKLCNSTGNSTPCAYPTEINRQQAKRLTALESERDALLNSLAAARQDASTAWERHAMATRIGNAAAGELATARGRIVELERKHNSVARLLCRHGDGLCVDQSADLAAAGKEAVPVAWMRSTDITELTDSEPETSGWIPLYTAPTADLEKGDGFSETTRLDFLIDQQAWVQWAMRDGSIRQCQVYTQDEDENYHVLSGEDRYFNAPREAIDAALSQKAGEQQ